MSLTLDAVYVALLKNQTPSLWIDKIGYPSLKPLSSWVSDLVLRVEFIENWL